MLTEKHLRENPLLIKAFMGLPAEVFWQLVTDMEAKLPTYDLQRLDREDRQREVGGGPGRLQSRSKVSILRPT